jgi:hypothetical protein
MYGKRNKFFIWVFKQNMGFQKNTEASIRKEDNLFKVAARFIPLKWVHKKPYPKFVNVIYISNYISKSLSFVTMFQFPCCLKIYSSGKQVKIIINDKIIPRGLMVFYMFCRW